MLSIEKFVCMCTYQSSHASYFCSVFLGMHSHRHSGHRHSGAGEEFRPPAEPWQGLVYRPRAVAHIRAIALLMAIFV